jgi:hypothetical protein
MLLIAARGSDHEARARYRRCYLDRARHRLRRHGYLSLAYYMEWPNE